jgi:hypothetical protein
MPNQPSFINTETAEYNFFNYESTRDIQKLKEPKFIK